MLFSHIDEWTSPRNPKLSILNLIGLFITCSFSVDLIVIEVFAKYVNMYTFFPLKYIKT